MGVNKVVFGAVAIMDISDSTVTPDKLAKGATAYDKSGEKITGTMEAASDPVLQEKTVTPKTSAQSVTADSGYDGLSKVTVNAMPTATQATPSITVSSAGLITASATQSAGYVAAGTKSATKQLTTQAAKTITPSTSNQTIAAGTYCSGTQTIKGDANLVAGNIKSGVSIFGVAGSYEGSGGSGGGSVETCTVTITKPRVARVLLHYTNADLNYQQTEFASPTTLTITIEVAKNTLLCCDGTITISATTGGAEIVDSSEQVAFISEDAEISLLQ